MEESDHTSKSVNKTSEDLVDSSSTSESLVHSSLQLDKTRPTLKSLFMPVIIILVIVTGALLAIKHTVNKDTSRATQGVLLTEGAEIPPLDFIDLEGKSVALSSLKHKVMLINFWATWCEACMVEMPSIVALREKYASQGFEVLGINVDENPKTAVPPTQKKFKMNFPIFTDLDGNLSTVFDVHAIPLSIIVDAHRKILYVESGERDWNDSEMNTLVERWLAN